MMHIYNYAVETLLTKILYDPLKHRHSPTGTKAFG